MKTARALLAPLAIALVALFGLTGCGFKPMYATSDSDQSSPLVAEMAGIRIAPIADHDGVVLRQDLRELMQPDGPSDQTPYELQIQMASVTQELGIRLDAVATRDNRVFTARFSLFKNGERVLSDQVQEIVSYNIAADQYATVSESNDVAVRAIRQIGEEIKTRIGVYLQAHLEKVASQSR